jgi:hypothetical protein
MVKKLTQHQLEIITELYHAVDGQARVYVPVDTIPHSPLYWLAHECRGLIAIEKKKRKGKVYRKIALTDSGVIWCADNGIYARDFTPSALMPLADKRLRTTLSFQVGVSDDLVGQVAKCKEAREFIPILRLAITLYEALGYEAFEALTKSTLNNFDIFQMSPDEISAAYAHIESEQQRLAFERAALEAQTLEVKQFHDMFRDIDAKLDSIQNARIPADNAPTRGLQPVSGATQGNGVKALNVPQFEAPKFDEDSDDDFGLEIKKDLTAAARTTTNFLKSIMSLTEDNPDKKTDYSNLSPRIRARMEKEKDNE